MQSQLASHLDTTIRLLDIIIAFGRYLLHIATAFALLSAAAAINSISTGNIAAAAFWVFVTVIGTIFAFQVALKRKYRSRIKRKEKLRDDLARVAEA
jgi:hypothetical protein